MTTMPLHTLLIPQRASHGGQLRYPPGLAPLSPEAPRQIHSFGKQSFG
jgi:hypothetical protein